MSIHNMPFIRMIFPLCLGITASSYAPIFISIKWAVAYIGINLFFFALLTRKVNVPFTYRWIIGSYYSLFFLGFGYINSCRGIEMYQENHINTTEIKNSTFVATLISPPIKKSRTYKVIFEVNSILLPNDSLVKKEGKLIAYIEQNDTVQYQFGDQVIFSAQLTPIPPSTKPTRI